MAFPDSTLDRVVQVFVNGAWTIATPYVYQRDTIRIERGSGGERSQTKPVTCSLTLDDRDRRWRMRDPAGAWAGSIRRNLPLAVGVRLGESYLTLNGSVANYVTTPDSAGTSPTGDIDVRVDVTLDYWRDVRTDLAGKYGAAGQRSWGIELQTDGTIRLKWSADGTAENFVASRIPVPWPHRNRMALRATLDVDNGAGGSTATFYYSTDAGVDGGWTQLGDPVITAGVTSVFNSTTATLFGSTSSGSTGVQPGRFHAGALRSGIGGTVVAGPDIRPQPRLTTSFSDGTNTWTLGGSGTAITNYRNEFVGEIPDFPSSRDSTGRDVYVPVVAQGITRRLGQGSKPVESTLRRAVPSIGTALRAYWPLEEGSAGESGASGVAAGSPMRWGAPAPALASFDAFAGSAPVPTMNGSSPRGTVRTYTSTGIVQVRCLLAVPVAGAANGAVIMRISTGGTAARWDLIYGTGGTLALTAFDVDGASLGGLVATAFAVDGRRLLVSVELSTSGANIGYNVVTIEEGETSGSVAGGTLLTRTVTTCRSVTLNAGGLLTDTAIGHVTVESAITSAFALGNPIAGWAKETAGRRIERLCSEQGIVFRPLGDLDDTARMGPQGRDTLLALMRECETTDGGLLSEPRDRLGLAYRPLSALYTPGTVVTLDGGGGTGGDLADYKSTDDDQLTRNDITVSRPNGSTYRVEQTTGVLSTSEPPTGVGRYDDSATVNVYTDDELPDQAGWRLGLGTIDEPRFPEIVVHLSRAALVADPGTTTAVIEADIGDGVVVTNPPDTMSPVGDDVRQVIAGRVVELGSHEYVTRWVGQPAAGYDVGLYELEHPDEESRYSSDGSTVNGAHTAGATTLSVATPSGPLWGFGSGQFTIRIPETGERMRVTNITGTSTPQSFTVTRGVDGTTAYALDGGETVELGRPIRWGLG